MTIVMPLVGPNNAKASVGTLGDADSGRTSTSSCPGTLPSAALLETHLNPLPDVVMALAAPLGDTCPSPATPKQVYRTRVTLPSSDQSPKVPLVERYQSVTPSPAPPTTVETAEDRMMRLLSVALQPIKFAIADVGS